MLTQSAQKNLRTEREHEQLLELQCAAIILHKEIQVDGSLLAIPPGANHQRGKHDGALQTPRPIFRGVEPAA